jgi:hypothetical protein
MIITVYEIWKMANVGCCSSIAALGSLFSFLCDVILYSKYQYLISNQKSGIKHLKVHSNQK